MLQNDDNINDDEGDYDDEGNDDHDNDVCEDDDETVDDRIMHKLFSSSFMVGVRLRAVNDK